MRSFIYLFIKFIAFFVFHLFFLIEIKGRKNIPKKGGFIIASNHLSYLDPPLIGFACSRKLYYFAKSSLFKIKVLSNLIKILGAIPIERESSPLSLRKGLDILKKGEGLVIFPEGTRSKNGEIKEGKFGIGFLVVKSKVPVIPVKLIGTNKALPPDKKFIRLKKIKVIIGEPLYIENKNYKEISKIVMDMIKRLE
ncbi:MAG: 1-acyl-sn-glycerol-3-phosphate acyltransferase [Candidatus Omnitrophica bacterium]|nr:1-acyl-sn-glycerol-3-phosphate acyltransferase [Candidatus Omnitrophota bacterium]